VSLTIKDLIKAFEKGWSAHVESQQTSYYGVTPPHPSDLASDVFDRFIRDKYPDLVAEWEKTVREE